MLWLVVLHTVFDARTSRLSLSLVKIDYLQCTTLNYPAMVCWVSLADWLEDRWGNLDCVHKRRTPTRNAHVTNTCQEENEKKHMCYV